MTFSPSTRAATTVTPIFMAPITLRGERSRVRGDPMLSTPASTNFARCNFVVSLAATILLLASSFPASAQEPPPAAPADSPAAPPIPSLFEKWKIQMDLGGRNYDLYGDHPGKLLQYRDFTRGFYVNGIDLRFESAESPYSFHFNASDIRELDETIQAEVWKVGRFRTTFLWDRLPFYYSNGTSLFQSPTPGNLVVSPSIRGAIQGLIDGQPPQNITPALVAT